jgi:hypothetical protein
VLKIYGDRIIWEGVTEFLGEQVSLFINGDTDRLDNSERISIQNILNDENAIELEIEKSLKEQ